MNRLQPGFPIYRGRANYGSLFSEQQEISYNTAHANKISAGRFNRPLEPLFYGALRIPNPKSDPVYNAASKLVKRLRIHVKLHSYKILRLAAG